MIDIAVVDSEVQFSVFILIDLQHLATEEPRGSDPLEVELTIRLPLDSTEIVVAACPEDIVLVAVDYCDTCDARRVDDVPFSAVVIHQTLEIGKVDEPVFPYLHIKVAAMGVIVVCHVILEEWETLGVNSEE